MKTKLISGPIALLCLSFLFNGCKEDGFPVPPASTVPLFSYTIDNDGFAPATVTFTNESIVPEPAGTPTYIWNFGDSTSSMEKNPTHLYATPGVKSVKLVVQMSVSLEIKTLIKNIVIKDPNASGIPVFFTDRYKVYSGVLNSAAPIFSELPIGPFTECYSLAVDTVNSKLYICDYGVNKIFKCDLDGANLVEFRSGLSDPTTVAIDYAGNKLYWDTGNGIQRGDLSSTDVNQKEDFATGQSANDPEGVSIDPVHSKVYWNSYVIGGGVWMKNLDGTGETKIETLSAIGGGGGNSLVVNDRLFFDQYFAASDDQLKSSNLDGSGISTVATGITTRVYGLAYDREGNKIYWCDRNAYKIMRANLDGSEVEPWCDLSSESKKPCGIVFGKKK
jgi:PKD repeat protein